jgi:hypothetical protein
MVRSCRRMQGGIRACFFISLFREESFACPQSSSVRCHFSRKGIPWLIAGVISPCGHILCLQPCCFLHRLSASQLFRSYRCASSFSSSFSPSCLGLILSMAWQNIGKTKTIDVVLPSKSVLLLGYVPRRCRVVLGGGIRGLCCRENLRCECIWMQCCGPNARHRSRSKTSARMISADSPVLAVVSWWSPQAQRICSTFDE